MNTGTAGETKQKRDSKKKNEETTSQHRPFRRNPYHMSFNHNTAVSSTTTGLDLNSKRQTLEFSTNCIQLHVKTYTAIFIDVVPYLLIPRRTSHYFLTDRSQTYQLSHAHTHIHTHTRNSTQKGGNLPASSCCGLKPSVRSSK